jgi:hypothetical protein
MPVGLEDDLCVRVGSEGFAMDFESRSDLGEVEDLAVEDDPIESVFGTHGLMAGAGEVQDG